MPHATAQPTNATALPTTTQTGHLGIDDAEHGHVHTAPDSLSQMGSSPSSRSLDGSPYGPALAHTLFETPTKKWENNLLAVDPRAIGQPPAATANKAAEPTAGTTPPAC